MSQTTEILNHLKQHGNLTPMEALTKYGCMRLASRINDLRGMGHPIETTIIRQGKKRWAKYCL